MAQTNPGIIGIDLSATPSTVAYWEPGTYVEQNGSQYVYIKSHAALTAGLVYSYLEASGLTVAALTQTTDDTSPISLCIPQSHLLQRHNMDGLLSVRVMVSCRF